MPGSFREIIDEFPLFSFLHADLHPHVLALPFGLLAIGIALHIYLGGWSAKTELFGGSLYISKPGYFFTALTLGGPRFPQYLEYSDCGSADPRSIYTGTGNRSRVGLGEVLRRQ